MVVSGNGLLALASPCAVVGASPAAAARLFTRAGGALPALPPPRAIALPAPAGVTCVGGGFVSGETLGLVGEAGPKGSAMPNASCRKWRGRQSLPRIVVYHKGQLDKECHDVNVP